MTKDELIEALAVRKHRAAMVGWTESGHTPSDFLLATYREQAEEEWPLIVEFVAEWIEANLRLCEDDARLPRLWREDMGA